eukprot:6173977-Pleurochrysis_carterae.AAC.2
MNPRKARSSSKAHWLSCTEARRPCAHRQALPRRNRCPRAAVCCRLHRSVRTHRTRRRRARQHSASLLGAREERRQAAARA